MEDFSTVGFTILGNLLMAIVVTGTAFLISSLFGSI